MKPQDVFTPQERLEIYETVLERIKVQREIVSGLCYELIFGIGRVKSDYLIRYINSNIDDIMPIFPELELQKPASGCEHYFFGWWWPKGEVAPRVEALKKAIAKVKLLCNK